MANQDILHNLWIQGSKPQKGIAVEEIGEFAKNKRNSLGSRSGQITPSGLNYAVLKFILEYCSPLNWPEHLWDDFERAKNPVRGKYGIWKEYPDLEVDLADRNMPQISYIRRDASLPSVDSIRDTEETIDCHRIFNRRIATTSKLYYFSDPWSWTVYDSRVASTLHQFAYLFGQRQGRTFDKLKDEISFPIPPSRVEREHLLGINYNKALSSSWFVRASILLKAIAERLKGESLPRPPEVLRPSDSWELYHVEMVFFRLGRQQWVHQNL